MDLQWHPIPSHPIVIHTYIYTYTYSYSYGNPKWRSIRIYYCIIVMTRSTIRAQRLAHSLTQSLIHSLWFPKEGESKKEKKKKTSILCTP